MVVIMVVVVVTSASVLSMVIMMLVPRCVFPVVPVVTDEVHGTPAGIVFGAVPCPMSFMSRRNMQINRPTRKCRVSMNDHRPRIDHAGRLRCFAKVDLPKKSGLSHIDRNAHIGCHDRCGDNQKRA